ncbi:hypothetical protein DEU56DRAFT_880215 [Suillus clintonianus]|uniref:uncharacterized protein n=1 Tax=Suillus clintonianus TaxID=1904413 RepID=UPI001B885C1F|nr:uncharacterized protein DEU56DRAFT_880215 [Suillus clintonianus]KAG2151496.1 hypothetical protein DEU56DRAFT_880215 [Suillus clintonianus]
MRLLLCILYLVRVIRAAPTTNSITINDSFEAVSSLEQRTLWSIVSTCTLTILACTYGAIHPNIPSPNDSSFRILWRRFVIMLVALAAPDVIIAWALRQRLWTQHITTEWTQTHSFFALMGGFMLYVDGKPFQTLSPDHLLNLIRTRSICGPTLTEKQIRDRSKGNVVSKGLILIQVSWFVLQLLSRAIYHLETTQFEVGTLAFAVLNFVTYALWWNKPLDVKCPHPVYWKSTESKPEVHVYVCASINSTAADHVPLSVPKNNGPMPLHTTIISAMDTFVKFFGIDAMSSSTLRVATFDGVCPFELTPRQSKALTLAGYATGIIFSAIHCAAWFYVFPTYEEQLLWQTSAAAITIGLCIALAVLLVLYKWIAARIDSVMFKLIFPVNVLYVIARITLFILMFTTLRDLPPDAYKTVSWSNFVPHL